MLLPLIIGGGILVHGWGDGSGDLEEEQPSALERLEEASEGVNRSTDDLVRADELSLSERLIGEWVGDTHVYSFDGLTMTEAEDVYALYPDGTYSNSGTLELVFEETPLLNGRYRYNDKGRYSIDRRSIQWDPSESKFTPVLASSFSAEKRRVMANLASEMSEDLASSQGEIRSFSREALTLRIEIEDGVFRDLQYRRRD
ncbi:MAG: hypothetical protein AAFZ11_12725 [Pseudomonadota bacterium]